ncbi:MAG TPA: hypothetical protein VKG25_03865, partial [Bryobacteraceae bacterium]|nr:hypothetical protein [Bryobacteraceae bacterium]
LFQPRDVWRSVNQASIDYFLKQAADKVTIDILDGHGALVRSFAGTPEDDKKKDDNNDEEAEFFGPRGPKPPARKAGVNRFTWDLRYPGSKTFEGMVLWSARAEVGPVAPPGDYAVRFTAAGVTQTAKFHVFRDPRLNTVTDEDLEKQFQLASQVRDRLSDADQMVIDIRSIKKQLKERVEKAKDPELNAAAERLETKLSAVEEEVYQVRNRSNQDPLNFPIKLNNMLGALARSIETGDARPTDQSYVVFKELSDRLDAQKAKLDEALRNNLPPVNEQLKSKGLEKVAPSS